MLDSHLGFFFLGSCMVSMEAAAVPAWVALQSTSTPGLQVQGRDAGQVTTSVTVTSVGLLLGDCSLTDW